LLYGSKKLSLLEYNNTCEYFTKKIQHVSKTDM
jgi:hypothetical protein